MTVPAGETATYSPSLSAILYSFSCGLRLFSFVSVSTFTVSRMRVLPSLHWLVKIWLKAAPVLGFRYFFTVTLQYCSDGKKLCVDADG